MIINHCKYSGLPLAVVPMFADMNIRAVSEHPIFTLPVRKLIDIAGSVKATQLSTDERVLMGLALAKSTGLVIFHTNLKVKGVKEETVSASFLLAARNLARVYQELVAAPKQIAVNTKNLPLFRVTEEIGIAEITNWCKLTLAKASAYVEIGRERKLRDESYGVAMALMGDDGTKLARNKSPIRNSDYALAQVYDADIGVWAYDILTDSFSEEVINEQAVKFQACYNLLTMTGSKPKASTIASLRDTLAEILPLDTPENERRKQLTIAYLDRAHSDIVQHTAELLGESVTTEVRKVGNKQWSYTVLAPSSAGAASGGTGASVSANGLPVVKAGHATAAKGGGHGLDNGSRADSLAPNAPQAATAAMVRTLRARMQRKGLMK